MSTSRPDPRGSPADPHSVAHLPTSGSHSGRTTSTHTPPRPKAAPAFGALPSGRSGPGSGRSSSRSRLPATTSGSEGSVPGSGPSSGSASSKPHATGASASIPAAAAAATGAATVSSGSESDDEASAGTDAANANSHDISNDNGGSGKDSARSERERIAAATATAAGRAADIDTKHDDVEAHAHSINTNAHSTNTTLTHAKSKSKGQSQSDAAASKSTATHKTGDASAHKATVSAHKATASAASALSGDNSDDEASETAAAAAAGAGHGHTAGYSHLSAHGHGNTHDLAATHGHSVHGHATAHGAVSTPTPSAAGARGGTQRNSSGAGGATGGKDNSGESSGSVFSRLYSATTASSLAHQQHSSDDSGDGHPAAAAAAATAPHSSSSGGGGSGIGIAASMRAGAPDLGATARSSHGHNARSAGSSTASSRRGSAANVTHADKSDGTSVRASESKGKIESEAHNSTANSKRGAASSSSGSSRRGSLTAGTAVGAQLASARNSTHFSSKIENRSTTEDKVKPDSIKIADTSARTRTDSRHTATSAVQNSSSSFSTGAHKLSATANKTDTAGARTHFDARATSGTGAGTGNDADTGCISKSDAVLSPRTSGGARIMSTGVAGKRVMTLSATITPISVRSTVNKTNVTSTQAKPRTSAGIVSPSSRVLAHSRNDSTANAATARRPIAVKSLRTTGPTLAQAHALAARPAAPSKPDTTVPGAKPAASVSKHTLLPATTRSAANARLAATAQHAPATHTGAPTGTRTLYGATGTTVRKSAVALLDSGAKGVTKPAAAAADKRNATAHTDREAANKSTKSGFVGGTVKARIATTTAGKGTVTHARTAANKGVNTKSADSAKPLRNTHSLPAAGVAVDRGSGSSSDNDNNTDSDGDDGDTHRKNGSSSDGDGGCGSGTGLGLVGLAADAGSTSAGAGDDAGSCVAAAASSHSSATGPYNGVLTFVIFGASGDLAAKKTFPALAALWARGLLPTQSCVVVGAARSELSREAYIAKISKHLSPDISAADRESFLANCYYQPCADYADDASYTGLLARLCELEGEKAAALASHSPSRSSSKSNKSNNTTTQAGAHRDGAGGHMQGSGVNGPHTRRVLYFAVPPEVFEPIAERSHKFLRSTAPLTHGHAGGTERGSTTGDHIGAHASEASVHIVVEKPFGHDLASAKALNENLRKHFKEREIYRIDHYLAKDMVQNMTVVRFANRCFEPLWNNQHIQSVSITFKEDIGAAGRAGYFDSYGILLDVMQNHLCQLLALAAMEPPVTLRAEDVRDEKVKLLKAVAPIKPENVVVGQYVSRKQTRPLTLSKDTSTDKSSASGDSSGKSTNASKSKTDDADSDASYRSEPGVPADSVTATFCSLALYIDNARWSGVPFLLKCGKGLNESKAEIRVQFKRPDNNLYACTARNELVIKVKPDDSIYVKMLTKAPGLSDKLVMTELDFTVADRLPLAQTHTKTGDSARTSTGSAGKTSGTAAAESGVSKSNGAAVASAISSAPPDAYERLLWDVSTGDRSLFVRSDELMQSWKIFTPVVQAIERDLRQGVAAAKRDGSGDGLCYDDIDVVNTAANVAVNALSNCGSTGGAGTGNKGKNTAAAGANAVRGHNAHGHAAHGHAAHDHDNGGSRAAKLWAYKRGSRGPAEADRLAARVGFVSSVDVYQWVPPQHRAAGKKQ